MQHELPVALDPDELPNSSIPGRALRPDSIVIPARLRGSIVADCECIKSDRFDLRIPLGSKLLGTSIRKWRATIRCFHPHCRLTVLWCTFDAVRCALACPGAAGGGDAIKLDLRGLILWFRQTRYLANGVIRVFIAR